MSAAYTSGDDFLNTLVWALSPPKRPSPTALMGETLYRFNTCYSLQNEETQAGYIAVGMLRQAAKYLLVHSARPSISALVHVHGLVHGTVPCSINTEHTVLEDAWFGIRRA